MWDQATLPHKWGGLGLTSATDLRGIGFMAATATTVTHLLQLPSFRSLMRLPPEQSDGIMDDLQKLGELPVLKECEGAFEQLQENLTFLQSVNRETPVPGARRMWDSEMTKVQELPTKLQEAVRKSMLNPQHKLQHEYAEGLNWSKFARHFTEKVDPKHHPRLQSQFQEGATEWLTCAPSEPALRFSPKEFPWAVSKWLGARTSWDKEVLKCEELRAGDNKHAWDHINICKKGGGPIIRHDAVKAAIAETCKAAGFRVVMEERALYEGMGNGGPDITVYDFPMQGKNSFVEVSVPNPSAHSSISATKPLATAEQATESKLTKYRLAAEKNEMDLWVAVVESTGGFSRSLSTLIRSMAKFSSVNNKGDAVPTKASWLSTSFRKYHSQKIAVALQKGCYLMARTAVRNLSYAQKPGGVKGKKLSRKSEAVTRPAPSESSTSLQPLSKVEGDESSVTSMECDENIASTSHFDRGMMTCELVLCMDLIDSAHAKAADTEQVVVS